MPTTIHILNYTVFLLLPYSQFYAYPLLGAYLFAVRAIGACALQQVDTVWLIFVNVCMTMMRYKVQS